MYKYIRAYKLGYNEGIKDAYYDLENKKIKKLIVIDEKYLISKLYDSGYIDGYSKIIKLNTLKNK